MKGRDRMYAFQAISDLLSFLQHNHSKHTWDSIAPALADGAEGKRLF